MGLASSVGIVSGINYADLAAQLAELEARPIFLLQSQQSNLNSVSAELSTLSIQLSGLESAATSLSSLSNFNTKSVAVTQTTAGVSLLSATVDSTAVAGTSQIKVNQLAQSHSIASQGFVDDDTTAVASAAGTFKFKVGPAGAVTSFSVTTTTTLVQLRDGINSANGSVNASIINDGSGSNPYRLVLTAKDSGSANAVTITSNPTTLDFTNKKIEDAFGIKTNSYAGTVSSNSSGTYSGTTNKTYLIEIVTGGTPESTDARYKYSIDGGITFLGSDGNTYVSGTNDVTVQTSLTTVGGNTEGVQISFGSGTGTLAVGDQFTIDVFNPTLQDAKDAVIEVGTLTISKSSNIISDVIQGVTLNLLQAGASTDTIDVKVSVETSGIKGQVDSFISAYNSAIGYLHTQLSFDPDSTGTATAQVLLGDFTAILLNRQLQDIIGSVVPGASSGLNSLAQLGVSTDTETSEISLDSSKFGAAVAASLTDVTRLFIGIGVPTNSQIDFVSKTDDTDPGSYGLVINTAPTRATVRGANAVSSSGITAQETISVNFYSDATVTGSTPATAQITAAVGSTANDIVNALNSEFATQKMDLTASVVTVSSTSNFIQVRSTEYGDDYRIQVLSSLNDPSNQSGFSTTVTDTESSTAVSIDDGNATEVKGVDIVGTINGFNANGKGAILTSGSGFADDGLSIRAEVSTTGNFGKITVSSGVADRMAALIARFVNTTDGAIKIRQDGIADSVEDIGEQIDRKSIMVAAFEQRTLQQFQRLEVLLNQFQIQGNALAAGLSSIANLQSQISNRR